MKTELTDECTLTDHEIGIAFESIIGKLPSISDFQTLRVAGVCTTIKVSEYLWDKYLHRSDEPSFEETFEQVKHAIWQYS